jgi:hypothetical protein
VLSQLLGVAIPSRGSYWLFQPLGRKNSESRLLLLTSSKDDFFRRNFLLQFQKRFEISFQSPDFPEPKTLSGAALHGRETPNCFECWNDSDYSELSKPLISSIPIASSNLDFIFSNQVKY